MIKFKIKLWLDGYIKEEDRKNACSLFINEQLKVFQCCNVKEELGLDEPNGYYQFIVEYSSNDLTEDIEQIVDAIYEELNFSASSVKIEEIK